MAHNTHTIKLVSELIPYINNSRTHSDTQVQQIAASIKEFGFTAPILIDDKNGIIAGHGRLYAAQLLGLEDVPCIVLDNLTEAQKKAYVIADNQLPMNAAWDFDMLRLEVESLQEMNFDIGVIGFDDDFIADIKGEAQKEDLTDPLEEPTLKKCPHCGGEI